MSRQAVTLCLLACFSSSIIEYVDSFKAASFDGSIWSGYYVTNRKQALRTINSNLDHISTFVSTAERLGADIIVLPEYGVTGFMEGRQYRRSSVYPYMERIPDVTPTTPVCGICNSPAQNTEIQVYLSCLAKRLGIYIAANMIEEAPCDAATDKDCPADGHYQYNTNVVFNRDGCLIAKYHKMYLYGGEIYRLNHPATPEHVYFDTEFGRIGTIICYDALFHDPGVTLVEKYNVDHILFPTAWDIINCFVALRPLQVASAIAHRWGVNTIAANVHYLRADFIGSGIFSPTKALAHISNGETDDSSLVIADIKNGTATPQGNSSHVDAAIALLQQTAPSNSPASEDTVQAFPLTIYTDVYNATILSGQAGTAKVCHNEFCCHIDFYRNQTSETFILAAFEGMHDFEGKYYVQSCILHKCVMPDAADCGVRKLSTSSTVFNAFDMYATFQTDYVYPISLPAEANYKKIEYTQKHEASGENHVIGVSDWPLVTLSMLGRVFEKDPALP